MDAARPVLETIDDLPTGLSKPEIRQFADHLLEQAKEGRVHRMVKEAPSYEHIWPNRTRNNYHMRMLKEINLQHTNPLTMKMAYGFHNASRHEVYKGVVRQMMDLFQKRNGDTGSTEVQVSVITVRINNLVRHLKENAKDKSCKRGLNKLIHRRRKLLEYLKRTDYNQYVRVIKMLGFRDYVKGWKD